MTCVHATTTIHRNPPHAREDRGICGIRASCNGLYEITITDALNTPRIDLFFAAIQPFQSFPQARATMEKWNADSAGWPIDDLLRAYLASLVENAKALITANS
jgi:hypothetical protein